MHNGKILIVEDEDKLRQLLKRIIALEGFTIFEAAAVKPALRLLEQEEPDVILCDIKLPDGNGIELTQRVRAHNNLTEVLLLTAFGNIPDSVQAIKNGAFDYITKGNDNEKIIPLLYRAMEKVQLQRRIRQLEEQVKARHSTFDQLTGQSPAIKAAIDIARKAAPSNASVLLLGETGTGKEMFAQAIHHGSKRSGKNFVAINCSALGKELLESEIFGYKAGAFTGAAKDKRGLVDEAHQGTLFLDEIGEMPFELQAKLLRLLESGEFIKVGDTRVTKADIRIIAATNRDLREEIAQGRFREDLYYRLNVFTILLPPLRERPGDIPPLARYFLQTYAARKGLHLEGMSHAFVEQLKQHDWRGNIRELKNVIERAVIISAEPVLSVESLPLELQLQDGSRLKPASTYDLATVEKQHIQRVMTVTKGNKTQAARLLNIGLSTLYRKLEEYRLV
ncbi:sigma-54-dependent transcriptional regulator [Chitinophaga vietnamensis]|uniref:sigma-54-dependent transcriptional regulator n=1 Tax=Chitinophaga vietnamensis TaxID=2593957 RepID=UPI001177A37F|nr:sigma-54 dependent transcriptional regulator [Chitinophaga vietnamensis]